MVEKTTNFIELQERIRYFVDAVCLQKNWGIYEAREKIGAAINVPGSTIKGWMETLRKNPITTQRLNAFAQFCFFNSQYINRQQVYELFAANGLNRDDIEPEFSQHLASTEIAISTVEERQGILEITSRYFADCREFAEEFNFFSGKSKPNKKHFIHTRIKHPANQAGPDESKPGEILAETLLSKQNVHAIISGSAGTGKTFIAKRLVSQLLQNDIRVHLPLILNWLDLVNCETALQALDKVKQHYAGLYPGVDGFVTQHFRTLDNDLSSGIAWVLIDNWHESNSSEKLLVDILSRWKNVVVFSRQQPALYNSRVERFEITELTPNEVNHFVKSWYELKEISDDSYKPGFPWEAIIQTNPMLLDVYLTIINNNEIIHDSPSFWEFLNLAINHLLKKDITSDAERSFVRVALSDMALSNYTIGSEFPAKWEFSATDIAKWIAKNYGLGERKIFDHISTGGIFRTNPTTGHKEFVHPIFQAALAAEALLQETEWLSKIRDWKNSPACSDLIRCMASKLAHEKSYPKLVAMLEIICETEQADVLDLNFLLAGDVLALLAKGDHAILDKFDVVSNVQNKLIDWLVYPQEYQLLVRVQRILSHWDSSTLQERLIAELRSAATDERKASAILSVLGIKKGEGVTRALITIANDTLAHRNIQIKCIDALENSTSPDAVAHLKSLLTDQTLRPHALYALARIGNSESIDTLLVERKKSKESFEKIFGQITNPDALPILRHAVFNPELDLVILNTIAKIGGKKATEILQELLHSLRSQDSTHDTQAPHRNEDTIHHIIRVLGQVEHQQASNILWEIADGNEINPSLRFSALQSLAKDVGLLDTEHWIRLLFGTNGLLTIQNKEPEMSTLRTVALEKLCRSTAADIPRRIWAIYNDSSSASIQEYAAFVLSHMRRWDVVPFLVKMLQNENYQIREFATEGLSLFQLPEIAPTVRNDLEYAINQKLWVGTFAEALGNIADVDSVNLLAQSIESNCPGHQYAFISLGRIGNKPATDILLKYGKQILNGESQSEMWWPEYCQALTLCGKPSCLEILIRLASQNDLALDVTKVHSAIADIKNPEAEQLLITALTHPVPDVRENAARALASIGSADALPGLVKLASDEVPWVRDAAISAIEHMDRFSACKNVQITEKLLELTSDVEESTQQMALYSFWLLPPGLLKRHHIEKVKLLFETSSSIDVKSAAMHVLGQFSKENPGEFDRTYLISLLTKFEEFSTRPGSTLIHELLEIGDPSFVAPVIKKTGPNWPRLVQPAFLPELLIHGMVYKNLMYRLCLNYNIRVMPDNHIYLPDGRYLPAHKAAKWL